MASNATLALKSALKVLRFLSLILAPLFGASYQLTSLSENWGPLHLGSKFGYGLKTQITSLSILNISLKAAVGFIKK